MSPCLVLRSGSTRKPAAYHTLWAPISWGVWRLYRATPLPPYRDIDLAIVLADDSAALVRDVPIAGASCDMAWSGGGGIESAEAVLSDPGIAPNLVANTILADPHGLLGPLQAAVAEQFTYRRWVRALREERQSVEAMQAALERAGNARDAFGALLGLTGALAGWLAVADCARPRTVGA